MADLKTNLIAFMRGQCDLDEVSNSLRELLANAPDKAPLVAELFERARSKGLDPTAYRILSDQLQDAAAAAAPPPPDPEFGDTVKMERPVLASPDAPQRPPADATPGREVAAVAGPIRRTRASPASISTPAAL